MSTPLAARRVAVTGGAGFLGSFVVERLRERGVVPFTARSRDHDLRSEGGAADFLDAARPEILIHLAARVGGIRANQEQPGRFLYDNLIMGARLIEAARQRGIAKFVCIGTTCSYPERCPVPFREESLWDGYPEPTNAPYGLAKKMLLVQLEAYRAQYGFNGIYLVPANLYGPRDDFDPESSHVIPALVRKCVEARRRGAPTVSCWGTGQATRDFLYVEDCAEGIVLAAERYEGALPVNLGTGREVAIREVAALVARASGFAGSFVWDATRPDGQPRRCLEVSRARASFGFAATTSLERGLADTVAWYEGQFPS